MLPGAYRFVPDTLPLHISLPSYSWYKRCRIWQGGFVFLQGLSKVQSLLGARWSCLPSFPTPSLPMVPKATLGQWFSVWSSNLLFPPPSLCKETTANPSASHCFTEFSLEKRRKQTHPFSQFPPSAPHLTLADELGARSAFHNCTWRISFWLGVPSLQNIFAFILCLCACYFYLAIY